MNILVTGGAGFIGSHFCKFLLKKVSFKKLTIVDKLTYAGIEANLADIIKHPKVSFIKSDINDSSNFESEFKAAELVFNFAAESHVDNSILGPFEFVKTNVMGTFHLLELLRNQNPNCKFVQVSTDEVYGSLNFDEASSTESSPLKPSSPYSASKASADLMALSYFLTYGLNILVTRSSNNYGPHQLPEKLIPKVITQAQSQKKVPVYGNGKNVRDWIFVEDNCEGIWKASQLGQSGKVYHFGSQVEFPNIEIVKKILNLMNLSEGLIEFVTDRKGHDLRYSLSTEFTQKELNWQPKTTFEDGLKKTIEWYLSNPKWMELANQKLQSRSSE